MIDRLVYYLYCAASFLVSLLPLGFIFRLGSLLGWLAYWTFLPYRKLAIANLTIAFGSEKNPAEIRSLARQHFCTLGANLLSSVKIASLSPEKVRSLVSLEGMEIIEQIAEKGESLAFICSHLGNWELLSQIAPLVFPKRLTLGTIYQRLGNPFIDADVRNSRARLGITPLERKEGFVRAISMLRNSGGVGVLIDQHAGDKGVWCPMFGRLASTTPLAATMALRTGAKLVPVAVYTDKPGHWRFVVSPEVPVNTRDAAKLTGEINLALEKQIRRSPADWFWVHNRWKTPNPNFLLAEYKRGILLPQGWEVSHLKPFNILVRSSNWLGDAVMATPAVQELKRGRPDVRLTVLTRAKLAEYWQRVPEVDEVIAIEPKDSIFAVAEKIKGQFDVAVILPNSIRTALEAWLAGIPRRVGYPGKWRRLLLNQVYIPRKDKKAVPRPARHQVHAYMDLAHWMGADVRKPAERDFFQNSTTAARETATSGSIKIGLCPGAEYGPAKRWLPERFAEVAQAVAQQRTVEWILFGVGGDAQVGDEIAAKLEGKCVNLIGKTTLSELMDKLGECRLLLTNDTGTMHLAAFLGIPTVSIFGSTEPRLTGPLGPHHQVLRHQVECSPCFLRECPLDFRCMKAVTVEETVAAVLRGIE